MLLHYTAYCQGIISYIGFLGQKRGIVKGGVVMNKPYTAMVKWQLLYLLKKVKSFSTTGNLAILWQYRGIGNIS
jgi:hypothetical protein